MFLALVILKMETQLSLLDETRTVNAVQQGTRLPVKRVAKRATTIREAVEKRDDGIARGLDHADKVKAQWRVWAYDYLAGLVKLQTAPFLAEDLIEKAEAEGVWCPPVDRRHYGGVIRALARDGVIRSVGTARAKTSNCSFKVLWARGEIASDATIQNKPD